MILLLTGASHTGKTALAQRLLEKLRYPYLSIDHLKMGLIRSGKTALTPRSGEDELTEYLWPIVREIVKTAVENGQNLIVEGCYLPLEWEKDFPEAYRDEIRFCCLVMSERYIRAHFEDIRGYAGAVERRLDDADCTLESVLESNARFLERAQECDAAYTLIDDAYRIDDERCFAPARKR